MEVMFHKMRLGVSNIFMYCLCRWRGIFESGIISVLIKLLIIYEMHGNAQKGEIMRITNKIMQSNNLANINTNKIYQDALSNQMSTQKKINRPSDDPVVAIRALRLRGSVAEVSQYYSKNIPDAESWIDVTEDALDNLSKILTDMIKQCTKGSNGDLKTSDRQIVLEQLKTLADEVYSTGDADYAGRYVFTGYRTDSSLSFLNKEEKLYSITEQLDSSSIDKVTVVNTYTMGTDSDGNPVKIDLKDLNSANYKDITVTGEDVKSVEVYRIRLAYNNCDDTGTPTITFQEKDADGVYQETTLSAKTIHSYDDPYSQVGTDSPVVFVPETGEILYSEDVYNRLMAVKDDVSTSGVNEGEIRVNYEKSQWAKGDLRPQHYFYCKSTDASTGNEIEYNKEYLTGSQERQSIEYDVGFNQTIRVNSTADECFNPGIRREVDDLVTAMQDVIDMEGIVNNLEGMLKTASDTDAPIIQSRLDAANEALTRIKDKTQKMFERGITSMQGYLDDSNLCLTNCGTRSSKLKLIESRMQTQKTTFETLKSNNEDIDIAEVAIMLGSAELTYQAALLATGKVAQTTLLNYI